MSGRSTPYQKNTFKTHYALLLDRFINYVSHNVHINSVKPSFFLNTDCAQQETLTTQGHYCCKVFSW